MATDQNKGGGTFLSPISSIRRIFNPPIRRGEACLAHIPECHAERQIPDQPIQIPCLYAKGVKLQSPASRSARWVTDHPEPNPNGVPQKAPISGTFPTLIAMNSIDDPYPSVKSVVILFNHHSSNSIIPSLAPLSLRLSDLCESSLPPDSNLNKATDHGKKPL